MFNTSFKRSKKDAFIILRNNQKENFQHPELSSHSDPPMDLTNIDAITR